MHRKVSVMMTTYNHEQYIGQAVTSVLEQKTDFRFELVVGEDCSADRTRDILLGLHAKSPETIRLLLRKDNWGRRRNFVDTFKSCRGEYIAILEGDDYWTSPHKLQRQVEFLDSNPDCTVCFHPVMRLYEDAGQSTKVLRPSPPRPRYTIEDLLEQTLIVTCSAMFRNRLFDEFPQWFYSVPAGDWPLSILNAQYGDIGYIDEVMAVYRIHSGGVWSSKSAARRLQGKLQILETLRQHLDLKYETRLNESITQTHLRIIQALAHDKDYKGMYLQVSNILQDKHVSGTAVAKVGLEALGRRVGLRG